MATDWSIFSIGMSLTYQCSNGYTMTGGESSRVLGCSGVGSNYAVWDGDFSPCLRNVNCTSEYRPYMRMTPDSGVVSVGNTVDYTCDPPYVLDNGDITGTNECTMYNETHGTWNTTQPSCEIAECPVIDHGRSNRNTTNTSLGTTVKITCKKGYVFSNYLEEVIIRCEFINGTGAVWSEALPRCRESKDN
ncbi:sushi, von Willebrand factor type A, EGF and pentraxin domain-containing protein 1-like [Lingula anatina]|uniref:Sushi, von Willebrand factor type A, EGF and pentraxin domain-containing protein 1-like n=1 Tax=Lingula anatina TaxID=7574 RepID=A0A1S3JUR1_LINAN|nr:sushi, von Willebrand factor type A, EGF and pentraxin domain-containing protein 1-like [Lingula anatina]|eukprot:XP_013414057.1 sushi, von Willebrand factor type A, EGF and pentraxin domain-containing protein 1-like [Lingula anatina]